MDFVPNPSYLLPGLTLGVVKWPIVTLQSRSVAFTRASAGVRPPAHRLRLHLIARPAGASRHPFADSQRESVGLGLQDHQLQSRPQATPANEDDAKMHPRPIGVDAHPGDLRPKRPQESRELPRPCLARAEISHKRYPTGHR